MVRHPRIKRSVSLFLVLLLTFLLSGCTFSSASPGKPSTQGGKIAPEPVGLQTPVCRLAQCTNFNPVKGTRPFVDTSENIHSALIFDYRVPDPAAVANNYDFVWGARQENMEIYRTLNPKIILSYYMTIHRDDGTFTETELGGQGRLAYWKQLHPDWILYKCDQKTPALQYTDKNIPFDITNPEVVKWQMDSYVRPASEAGYDALAVDNIDMENIFGACGHFDKNGEWVQLYTGQNTDIRWQTDQMNWVVYMQKQLHALPHPLLLIGNFSTGAVTIKAPTSQTVIDHVDGILDESSFTHFGNRNLGGSDWLHLVQYISSVQEKSKPFFIVNQVQKKLEPADTEWIYASYLMANQRLAMVNISGFKAYGHSNEFPELKAHIGSPKGDMYSSQYVYWRDFTGGEVVVNPSSSNAQITTPGTTSYVDPYGKKIEHSFTLPAMSALILLNA
ncbi:hypothetical protein KDA_08710 [Dictyobacter alpinus]|uniref:Glycoside-hydrolase family GH114 TIM-barrel domain-containing protein n=1 Tax=Dictyobacter alpinus TaxID=2014873 RepID=A0A402B249_9CHLR|nr:putative glycoside hydrolase [Dictyobacter alpinus]GCE25387.1 hypothetical protein KDA_08710 [Dictyobacter alpinus]